MWQRILIPYSSISSLTFLAKECNSKHVVKNSFKEEGHNTWADQWFIWSEFHPRKKATQTAKPAEI